MVLTTEDKLLQFSPLFQEFFRYALLALQDPSPIRRVNSIEVCDDTISPFFLDLNFLPHRLLPFF